MVSATNLVEYGYAVRDLVSCAQCGNPMGFDGSEFRCPRNQDSELEGCPTPPWNGDALLRAVVGCLMDRLMNDQVTGELVADAAREIHESHQGIMTLLRDLEQVILVSLEADLARARAGDTMHDSAILEAVIKRLHETFQNLQSDLESGEPLIAEDAFLRSPEGLRDTARDPGTYLDHATPADTRHLIELFVTEIRVGPDSLELLYRSPLPDQDNRATVTSERLVF